jgi:hypothetical protein
MVQCASRRRIRPYLSGTPRADLHYSLYGHQRTPYQTEFVLFDLDDGMGFTVQTVDKGDRHAVDDVRH